MAWAWGRGIVFLARPLVTLTGWEKIRNMHSSDFRSGQKGLSVANSTVTVPFGQAECRGALTLAFLQKYLNALLKA